MIVEHKGLLDVEQRQKRGSVNMPDRVNQQFGQYRLLRLLGQGGFAEVYLGEHVYLGTLAAVKVLHTQVDEKDIGEFQQEARMLASLRHPHIVRVLDFGVDGRTPYLVMDYASGGTLRSRHPKGTRLPLSTVVDYVKQIGEALQYAHERKVIHRDIKPENILVGENGEILLSDFGIALIAQSSRYHSTKDMAGTIAYMAPEQIEAHPRSASDQYSLAIVVYEWLSGIRPFQGSFTEIAIKHSVTPPPSLREILPALSPEVEQVILTALAKKPEERFTTLRAFALTLEQASERSRPSNLAPLPYSSHPIPDTLAAPPVHMAMGAGSNAIPAMQQVQPIETRGAFSGQVRPVPAIPVMETMPTKQASRRAIIISAGVVAVATVAGGTFAIVHSSSQPNTSFTSTSTSTPMSTSIPASTSTSTPISTPPRTVLYQPNWSSGLDGWSGSAEWKWISLGTISSDGSGSDGSSLVVAPYPPLTPDYAVEARIQFSNATNQLHSDFGIAVRLDTGRSGYYCGIDIGYKASFITPLNQGLVGPFSGYLEHQSYNTIDSASHLYRVELKGDALSFLIDGHVVNQVTNDTFLDAGTIGFKANSTSISITDVRVLAL